MRLKLVIAIAIALMTVSQVSAVEERGKITRIDEKTRTIDFDSSTSEGPFGPKDQIQVPNDLKIFARSKAKSGKVKDTLIRFEDLKVGDYIIVVIPLGKVEGKDGLVAGPPSGLYRDDDKKKKKN